jgi:hypothetical protein
MIPAVNLDFEIHCYSTARCTCIPYNTLVLLLYGGLTSDIADILQFVYLDVDTVILGFL